jgi:hypothetical protein
MICDKYRGKNTGPQCVNTVLPFSHYRTVEHADLEMGNCKTALDI